MWRTVLLVLPIVAILVFAIYYLLFAWSYVDDVPMSTHGYVAMAIGVFFSLALAGVLIVLLLRRDRED